MTSHKTKQKQNSQCAPPPKEIPPALPHFRRAPLQPHRTKHPPQAFLEFRRKHLFCSCQATHPGCAPGSHEFHIIPTPRGGRELPQGSPRRNRSCRVAPFFLLVLLGWGNIKPPAGWNGIPTKNWAWRLMGGVHCLVGVPTYSLLWGTSLTSWCSAAIPRQ